MGIRVRATQRGYMGRLIEPGEEFEIEKTSLLGSWMEPIDKKAFKAAKKRESKGIGKVVAEKDDGDGSDDEGDDSPPES